MHSNTHEFVLFLQRDVESKGGPELFLRLWHNIPHFFHFVRGVDWTFSHVCKG